ncbi:proteinase-activated receptor 1-like [Conger conger]|uniref:proteinase-activated receptor 1-like n=1 Tax=Conger conger TaxID=82655 RepID=UPI002A5ADDBE|nr:proteinase-activated receptor 1-like [Conger conger]
MLIVFQPKRFQLTGEDTKVISKEAQLFLTGSLLTTVIPSIYVLVFIISFPLNAAAVFMFSLRVRPQKPAAIFMLNLATADLLFVLLLPFKASYSFNGNNWVYGPAMCSVVTAAFYCNMYCSVLLMMSISADRFLAVVYPIRSLAWRRRRNAVAVCSAMWLLAVAGVIPILLYKQTLCLPRLGITTCHDVLDLSEQRSYYLYFFRTFSCAFFFIPLVVTTACYVCIIQVLRRTSGSKRSKKTRAVVMAFTVLTVFVVCFTPSNVLLLVHYSQFADQHSANSYAAYLVSVCIGSVSCCLDPVIYYYGSSQCRKNIARLLHCQAPPGLELSTITPLSSIPCTKDRSSGYRPGGRGRYRSRQGGAFPVGIGWVFPRVAIWSWSSCHSSARTAAFHRSTSTTGAGTTGTLEGRERETKHAAPSSPHCSSSSSRASRLTSEKAQKELVPENGIIRPPPHPVPGPATSCESPAAAGDTPPGPGSRDKKWARATARDRATEDLLQQGPHKGHCVPPPSQHQQHLLPGAPI